MSGQVPDSSRGIGMTVRGVAGRRLRWRIGGASATPRSTPCLRRCRLFEWPQGERPHPGEGDLPVAPTGTQPHATGCIPSRGRE